MHRQQCRLVTHRTSLIAARFIGSTCSIRFSRLTADLLRCSGTENRPAINSHMQNKPHPNTISFVKHYCPCRIHALSVFVNISQVRLHQISPQQHRNVEQVANPLCLQANSASYPQQDGKWIVAYLVWATRWPVWLIGAVVCLLVALWAQLSVSKVNGWPHNALQYH